MNVQSGKNYVTHNLDVRTIIDGNLYENYNSQKSSRDHLYKIDTDPRSDIGEYFISILFQIIDYQRDLLVSTTTSIAIGDDEGFTILLDDAEENSVLLNCDNGYEDNIVIIKCYNDDEIKILDKIKRLHEKINK